MSPWTLTLSTGDAGPFHHRADPVDPEPALWVHRITRPALVLGSSQAEADLDRAGAEADGVEVCRRRSGGGVVHLVPGDHCWIDLVIPASSRLWSHDVGLAFDWVGVAWAGALRPLLPRDATIAVHRGEPERRDQGRRLCFAGLGQGEVTVDGAKVVGLSQRRWRTGARFQCAAVWRWRPEAIAPLLSPTVRELVPPAGVAAGLGCHHGPPPDCDAVLTALLAALPEP